ncbi:hypothetical protein [Sphingomonas sp. TZW2008]|uniref:hypothetical protein n=1 Tax=Sphingomonas sp. TZW2008 TaxID=1917973 RepID=UPI000A270856|nr:hypothetical protein [Sphingomonas sp. TZW2008]
MIIHARAARPRAAIITIGGIALALLVALLAIDRQAYWMDELGTWSYARAANLPAWITRFLAIDNSDGQLPAYHFLIFLWSRLFGVEEAALRSLNAVFLAGTVAAILRSEALARPVRFAWCALLLISCFTWAYLNEARPYVMLMMGATFLLLALAWAGRSADEPRAADAALLWLVLGGLVSFAASPVAAPLVIAAVIGATVLAGRRVMPLVPGLLRRHILLIVICVALAALLAGLVLYSMAKGATPELGNKTSAATLIYGAIEVLGGAGLAPDRDALRQAGIGAIAGWQWAALSALAIGAAVLTAQALRSSHRRLVASVLAVTVVSILGVAIGGIAIGFRVVGRHIAFASPMLLLVVAIGMVEARARATRLAALLIAATMLLSTAVFHVSDRHGKDETRAAADAMARVRAAGGRGWWIGTALVRDRLAVPTISLHAAMTPAGRGAAMIAATATEDWRVLAPRLPPPQAMLVERPETVDADGFFRRLAQRHGLVVARRLRGYVIYSAR